jgi:AcrR family transcriptional regulator
MRCQAKDGAIAMVKTWSHDDPKAALMSRKRMQIVDAALKAFLDRGYAESSVNKIADDAGVSIKTLYRHFESKDDLFSAVMQAACSQQPVVTGDVTNSGRGASEPSWYAAPPDVALSLAGAEYLRHILSDNQLGIFRVVVRDAHRFPELQRRYREEIVGRQAALFADYFDRWQPAMGWKASNKYAAAAAFGSLLKAGIFDDAIQGLRRPEDPEIQQRARWAARCTISLLETGLL